LQKASEELKQVEAELGEKTENFSVKRKIAAQNFEQKILVDLGREKIKFQILFKKREEVFLNKEQRALNL
jgi:DNA repair ATPase RecN